MANLCIIQTYQSFYRKWSEGHWACVAGAEQLRDLLGGGGDQDDEAGQELTRSNISPCLSYVLPNLDAWWRPWLTSV